MLKNEQPVTCLVLVPVFCLFVCFVLSCCFLFSFLFLFFQPFADLAMEERHELTLHVFNTIDYTSTAWYSLLQRGG